MNKQYLAIVTIIVILNTVLLNNWGHDPVFMIGPSFSLINGEYFLNTFTNYEQDFYSGYLYGIYAFLFSVKGLLFIPFIIYRLVNITLLLLVVYALLKRMKDKTLSFLIYGALLSSTIITGPRCEVLPMTFILLIVYILENNTLLDRKNQVLTALLLSVLPLLHPMAALQGGLVLLWYFIEKYKIDKTTINLFVLAALSFLILIGFKVNEFIEPYMAGTASREMDSHSWAPLSTFKFLTFNPLFVILLANFFLSRPKTVKIVFVLLSLLISQMFGRSYYAIYVTIFIIIFSLDDSKSFDLRKYRYSPYLINPILIFNVALLMIAPVQAMENPEYYKTINNMAKTAHEVVLKEQKNGPDTTNHVWAGYRLSPALYDIHGLRFYWSLTPELNGLGYVNPGDIFICTDRDEYITAFEIASFQKLELDEITTDKLVSSGLLRTNLKRTDSLTLRIFTVR